MAILETDDLILEPDESTRFEISCSRSGASAAWSSDHLILSPSREEESQGDLVLQTDQKLTQAPFLCSCSSRSTG